MKILVAADVPEDPNSGVAGTEYQTIQALRALGHEVDAVAFAPVCWCEDYLALDLLEECHLPVLLRPLPGMDLQELRGEMQSRILAALEDSDIKTTRTTGWG